MDLLGVFSRSRSNVRRASMSDYEEVKSMVNAAAQLANAAKAEMERVEAEEEFGKVINKKDRNENVTKTGGKVKKGATVDIVPVYVPQIAVIDVDGRNTIFFFIFNNEMS